LHFVSFYKLSSYLYLRWEICLRWILLEMLMYKYTLRFLGIHRFALSSPQRDSQEVWVSGRSLLPLKKDAKPDEKGEDTMPPPFPSIFKIPSLQPEGW
jgi:hypothetical protein